MKGCLTVFYLNRVGESEGVTWIAKKSELRFFLLQDQTTGLDIKSLDQVKETERQK